MPKEKPGLWANIRAQRARGEKPARKGSKDYKAAVKAAKEINKTTKNESQDHEVSMAYSSLEGIVNAAQELMAKLGNNERNIPGWIQNHITNAENYIEQAAQGFHELGGNDSPEDMSLTKMMEELQPSTEKNKPITNISQLQKKFRDISIQLPKIKGIDAKEATNISNLLDSILSKLSKGSIGTSIGKSSDYFNKSTNIQ